MSTHLHYPEVYSVDNFTSLLHEASSELQTAINFLHQINNEPFLLLEKADYYLKSQRNIVVAVMSTSYLKQDKVTPHAFQVYLGEILDKAVKKWGKERQIEEKIEVKVRNPNSFPSLFAVYVNDTETIQFNIFERWYGIRNQPQTQEAIVERSKKSLKRTQDLIDTITTDIEKWEGYRAKPFSLVSTFYDFIFYFAEKKVILQGIEEKLVRYRVEKNFYLEDKKKIEDNLPKQIESSILMTKYIQLITPLFESLGYALETEKHKLY